MYRSLEVITLSCRPSHIVIHLVLWSAMSVYSQYCWFSVIDVFLNVCGDEMDSDHDHDPDDVTDFE